MDHQDWDFASDDASGDPETTDTAELGEYDAGLGTALETGLEAGTESGESADFGDEPAGTQPTGFEAQALDGLDEPLGTEDAAANYDAAIGEAGQTDQPADPADAGNGAEQGLNNATDDPNNTDGTTEALVGTDPDIDPIADDDGWDAGTFPPQLGLGEPPEPVDGFPWSDPATLGGADHTDPYSGAEQGTQPDAQRYDDSPDAADLAGYDNADVPDGADPWQVLVGSDDPATSSLARWWSPGA